MDNPNKKLNFLLRLMSYILVAALSCVITLLLFGRTTKLEKLEKIISQRFIGQADTERMEDAAASAMIAALGDRWSYYIPASAYETYEEGKTNSYVGIGITIVKREDDTGFDIVQVEPDGTAQEAGILPGDILIEAEGQPLAGAELEVPSQLIGGKEGTYVTVTVLRDGEKLMFRILRQTIQMTVAEGTMLPGNIGYVKIANFNDTCAEQTIAAIDDLLEQGAESLVFDVRFNSGGYVEEMVEVLDYLLPEGVLFQSVRYDGTSQNYDSEASCIELPMAVLVNANSYSAAEFFAAAMSEYDWAVVVGEPTSGKGYFQNTFMLGDGSAVALSVGQYYTPKGVSLAQIEGLTPDVTVEVEQETAAMIYAEVLAAEEDPQLQAAITALEENG